MSIGEIFSGNQFFDFSAPSEVACSCPASPSFNPCSSSYPQLQFKSSWENALGSDSGFCSCPPCEQFCESPWSGNWLNSFYGSPYSSPLYSPGFLSGLGSPWSSFFGTGGISSGFDSQGPIQGPWIDPQNFSSQPSIYNTIRSYDLGRKKVEEDFNWENPENLMDNMCSAVGPILGPRVDH